ncbi:MAG: alanine racemase, partial [Bacillota bacterium]
MALHRTWLEINKTRIKNNFSNIKKLISENTLFLGVVKGNAWGLGTAPYAATLVEAGVDWLATGTLEDAL